MTARDTEELPQIVHGDAPDGRKPLVIERHRLVQLRCVEAPKAAHATEVQRRENLRLPQELQQEWVEGEPKDAILRPPQIVGQEMHPRRVQDSSSDEQPTELQSLMLIL